MVWLTLRRLRTEIIIVAVVAIVLALALLSSGMYIHSVYDQSGVAHCVQYYPNYPGTCGEAFDAFFGSFDKLRGLMPWLNLFPLFIGIVLGVPLFTREFEEGTYTFALTQGISRRRWALTLVSVPVVFVVGFSLLITLIMTWWNAPFEQIETPFGIPSWDFEGVMPLAFGLLAFALSACAGGVLRRTVPAIAVAFAYVPLWLLADTWLRTVVPAPIKLQYAYQNAPTLSPRDWIISEGIIDSSGHPVNSVIAGSPQPGLQGYTIYQPMSHYWLVQGIEAAFLIGCAALLLAAVVWYLSHLRNVATT